MMISDSSRGLPACTVGTTQEAVTDETTSVVGPAIDALGTVQVAMADVADRVTLATTLTVGTDHAAVAEAGVRVIFETTDGAGTVHDAVAVPAETVTVATIVTVATTHEATTEPGVSVWLPAAANVCRLMMGANGRARPSLAMRYCWR